MPLSTLIPRLERGFSLWSGTSHTLEDWRILRALSLYRLLLVILLLMLHESGYTGTMFGALSTGYFHSICLSYALAALLILLPVQYGFPSPRIQAHLQFGLDLAAIAGLTAAAGGASSGLGMLLVTPAVSCSLVLDRRSALLQAMAATLIVVSTEWLATNPGQLTPDITASAVLGTILLGSSFAANAVAQRARYSEAQAARVGMDLAQLSRLNERIIANLQTGVLLINEDRQLRLLNAAARRLIGLSDARPGQQLDELFPTLVEALDQWQVNPLRELPPLIAPTGHHELIARPMALGVGAGGSEASTMILLEEATRVREQAQQMKLAALARLSASIAHEIRNPLSAIHQAGQLLAESPTLTAQELRLVSMIVRHSERINRIVESVMGMSRRDEAIPARLDLHSWLIALIEQYEEGAPARVDAIQLDENSEHAVARFDPAHLQRILFNFWDNSFDHGGRPASEIRVRLHIGTLGEPPQSYLDIMDNGLGIPSALLDRVFEPFFSTSHGGTGLGLYLSRELCDNNQARLEYRPGDPGACFRIIFAATGEH